MSAHAPDTLYQDVFALTGVLLETLEEGESHGLVRHHLGQLGLDLLEAFALNLREPTVELFATLEAMLLRLQVQLNLAHALRIVDEPTYLDLGAQSERVGAAFVGWRRATGLWAPLERRRPS